MNKELWNLAQAKAKELNNITATINEEYKGNMVGGSYMGGYYRLGKKQKQWSRRKSKKYGYNDFPNMPMEWTRAGRTYRQESAGPGASGLRPLTGYQQYVRQHYNTARQMVISQGRATNPRDLNKEIIKFIAKEWRASGNYKGTSKKSSRPQFNPNVNPWHAHAGYYN